MRWQYDENIADHVIRHATGERDLHCYVDAAGTFPDGSSSVSVRFVAGTAQVHLVGMPIREVNLLGRWLVEVAREVEAEEGRR